jgi:lipopolysaccharide export LptBFGC system permease protein LptF
MVFILHRYIFRELLKIFILASLALGVMMSLGSILRPVQEYGVGPRQVFDLLCYFIPVTMTFVLPVAALFATTLVYGRFAADNEFDACRASGISPSMLFYPAIILAIIISIANLLLSFHVVPAYVQRAEAAIKADVKQILFRNIQRQGFYSMPGGRFRIYADAADLKNSALLGVIIVDNNPKKEKKLITAEAATINFETDQKKNEVKIFARNAYQVDSLGGVFFKAVSILGEFGNLLSDDVKFRKIEQINAIKLQPMTYPPIADRAYDAYEQLTLELLNNEINAALKSDQLCQMSSDNVIVRFKAEKSVLNQKNDTIELLGKAELYEYDKATGELEKNFHGEKIVLQLSGETETRPSKKVLLIFPNAVWLDRGVEFIKPRYSAKNLHLPDAVAEKLGEDIIATATEHKFLDQPSPAFGTMIENMNHRINRTFLEIKAEIHSRLVFGIGCITLILIGTELGIRFKGGHLLTAFGISSIPAAALLIFIMMGKNIMKNQKSVAGADMGVILMWSGLALLTIISFMLYRKLLKN